MVSGIHLLIEWLKGVLDIDIYIHSDVIEVELLCWTESSLLCHGVSERWRSHVSHSKRPQIQGGPSAVLRGRNDLRSTVPAQQRNHLQVEDNCT